MITKEITLDGNEFTIGMSALIPRFYRKQFKHDLVTDMHSLSAAYQKATKEGREIPPEMMEILENVAWVSLKHGGSEVGSSPEEWLETLGDPFCVYALLPVIIDMWAANNKTTSVPRKK